MLYGMDRFANNMFLKKTGENRLARRKTSGKKISWENFCNL